MQESYEEDLANHFGLNPYADGGNDVGVASIMFGTNYAACRIDRSGTSCFFFFLNWYCAMRPFCASCCGIEIFARMVAVPALCESQRDKNVQSSREILRG